MDKCGCTTASLQEICLLLSQTKSARSIRMLLWWTNIFLLLLLQYSSRRARTIECGVMAMHRKWLPRCMWRWSFQDISYQRKWESIYQDVWRTNSSLHFQWNMKRGWNKHLSTSTSKSAAECKRPDNYQNMIACDGCNHHSSGWVTSRLIANTRYPLESCLTPHGVENELAACCITVAEKGHLLFDMAHF